MQATYSTKHVFLSYVHEDHCRVKPIARFFEREGILVWFDKSTLLGGENWREKIREAIFESAFFLPCFSRNFLSRQTSYVYEEMSIAVASLMSRNPNQPWFIPLLLENCVLPTVELGPEIRLQDLQMLEVFRWGGLKKLWETTAYYLSPPDVVKQLLLLHLKTHIKNKIKLGKKARMFGRRGTPQGWRSLLDDSSFQRMFEYFFELRERAHRTQQHEYSYWVEPGLRGRHIVLSVVPHQKMLSFLDALPLIGQDSKNRYIQFIIDQRRVSRRTNGWQYRDLVHCLYCEQGQSTLFDMLYLPSFDSFCKSVPDKQPFVVMEPTSILNTQEAQELMRMIYVEDSTSVG